MDFLDLLKLIDNSLLEQQLVSHGTMMRRPDHLEKIAKGYAVGLSGPYCEINDSLTVSILVVNLVDKSKPLNKPKIVLDHSDQYVVSVTHNNHNYSFKDPSCANEIIKRIPDLDPKIHSSEIMILGVNFGTKVACEQMDTALINTHMAVYSGESMLRDGGCDLKSFTVYEPAGETNLEAIYDEVMQSIDNYLVQNNMATHKTEDSEDNSITIDPLVLDMANIGTTKPS